MWMQQAELVQTNRLIMIFIGMIAVAFVLLAVVLMVVAVKVVGVVKSFSATAEELKAKVLPLLDEAKAIGSSSREILDDAKPKIKVLTANFVETSETLKATTKAAKSVVEHCDATIADANVRAQRQVARVDGMVTAALNTTAEVVEAIGQGLKVPAQRIAVLAGQARSFAEGLIAKFRARRAPSAPAEPLDEAEEPPYV
jgi:uncharacterized protein YoxC